VGQQADLGVVVAGETAVVIDRQIGQLHEVGVLRE